MGPSGGKHAEHMHTSQIMIHFSNSSELGDHVYLFNNSYFLYETVLTRHIVCSSQ